jgi:carbon storage regulator CsrA
MLVFTRRIGETFTIGKGADAVDVTLGESDSGPGTVRLYFDAPHNVSIQRREIAADKAITAALKLAVDVDDSYTGDNLMWVIDQMVRELAGSRYGEIIRGTEWDEGTAPAARAAEMTP